MKKIKVKFVDNCSDLRDKDNYLYPYLSEMYDVEISDEPDYLICSVFGHEHIKYDCVKIVFIGENLVPDFNYYDYSIGFDHIQFGDRHLRVPLYNFYDAYKGLLKQEAERDDFLKTVDKGKLLNRDFCSFVVSNGSGDQLRTEFFNRLSKYKKVASGGRYLNNIGGPVKDKLDFCSKYKFNIAFENSASPGYTTEKIMEPLSVNSVPIYWGNPMIGTDFNEKCMVRVKDRDDIDRVIEEIIYLDTHDDAYLEKCLAPRLTHPDPNYYDDQIRAFLKNIIEQPLDKAKRLIPYGWQHNYRGYENLLYRIYDKLDRPMAWARFVRTRLIKLGLIKQMRRV